MPSVAGGARHVEPSALHGIVGTRGAGRSAATTRRTLLPRFLSRVFNSTASANNWSCPYIRSGSVQWVRVSAGR
jgi:hypothetical protein